MKKFLSILLAALLLVAMAAPAFASGTIDYMVDPYRATSETVITGNGTEDDYYDNLTPAQQQGFAAWLQATYNTNRVGQNYNRLAEWKNATMASSGSPTPTPTMAPIATPVPNATAVPAPTTGPDGKPFITLNAAQSQQMQNHTYNVYEMFKGIIDETSGKMSVTGWGDSITDPAAFIEALKADDKFLSDSNDPTTNAFKDATDAASVAKVLSEISSGVNHPMAVEFAKVANDFLGQPVKVLTNANPYAEVDPGYYLIKDVDPNTAGSTDDFTSANILEVVKDVTIQPKGTVPQSGKGVTSAATAPTEMENKKTDTADIGDTVYFTLSGTVSNQVRSYDEYFYEFEDHLSDGLTFKQIEGIYIKNGTNNVYQYQNAGTANTLTQGNLTWTVVTPDAKDNPAEDGLFERTGTDPNYTYAPTADQTPQSGKTYVKIGITENTQFALTTPANVAPASGTPENGGGVLKVTMPDLRKLSGNGLLGGETIVVVYSAVVNKNAIQGGVGNSNEVILNYSNDPNNKNKGKSTPSESTVFTVELDVEKINASSRQTKLKGAEFQLVRESTGGVREYAVLTRDTEFKKNDADPAEQLYYPVTYTWNAATKKWDETVDRTQEVTTADATLVDTGWTADDTAKPNVTGANKKVPTATTGEYTITGWVPAAANATTLSTELDGDYCPIKIKGLEYNADYILVETKAPAGYTVPAAPGNETTVKITATSSGTTADTNSDDVFKLENLQLKVLSGDADNGTANGTTSTGDNDAGTVGMSILNSNDLTLPTTGGIGTTIFYIVGALLMFGAAVTLVARRRVGAK